MFVVLLTLGFDVILSSKGQISKIFFLSCLLLGVFSLVSVVYVHCSCLLAIILFFSVD